MTKGLRIRTTAITRSMMGLLVLMLLAAGCAGSDGGGDTPTPTAPADETESPTSQAGGEAIRIAVVSDLSGPLATSLGTTARGYQTYMQRLNADGGIDGRTVELELVDSQSDPSAAGAAFQQALSGEPQLLVYSGISSSVAGSATAIEDAGVPVLTDTAPDAFLYPPRDLFFMPTATARNNGIGLLNMADRVLEGLDGKRVAVAYTSTAYAEEVLATVEGAAEDRGFEVVAAESVEIGAASASSQANNIAQSEPDVILIANTGGEAPAVVGALMDQDIGAPMVGWTAASTPELFERFKSETYYAARDTYLPSQNDTVQSAAEEYGTADSANTVFFMHGWLMASLTETAFKECGPDCDAAGLTDQFEQMSDFAPEGDVTFGPISFSPEQHAGLTEIQFYSWDPDEGAAVPSGDPISVR